MLLALAGGGAPASDWTIGPNNTPLWAGEPYLPLGLRIEGAVEDVRRAKEAGVGDVLVELPVNGAAWGPVIQELERLGLRYLVQISSLAPAPTGVAIEPQGYRIAGITQRRRVEVRIPGATRALLVLAVSRDGSISDSRVVEVRNGLLSHEVVPGNELEHVLLIYPVLTEPRVPDAWEGLDEHRDGLMAALRHHRPAMNGLRGIVDPMGRVVRFPEPDAGFVPTSRLFRMELEAHLRRRYTTPAAAIRAWAIRATDLETFEQLARLAPLWTQTRGVAQLWDPDTGRLHWVEQPRSQAWTDIQAVIRESLARRYANLVRAVREVAGVPVLQSWAGWPGPYASQMPELDGMGGSASTGSAIGLIDSLSRPAAATLRWRKPGWFVATDLRIEGEDPARGLAEALADSASMGARGWFVTARSDSERRLLGDPAVRAAVPPSLAGWRPVPLFYPEAARNPAAPMRLPGGVWWLPSPGAGNRLDLGSQYAAYRLSDGSWSAVVIWSLGPAVRARLRAADPRALRVRTLDGSDPQPRVVRGGLEVTLGPTPLVVDGSEEIPVPEAALEETLATFERAVNLGGARVDAASGEVMGFREAVEGFGRNPGGSFLAMRTYLDRLASQVGDWVWIEGEASRENTWGEPKQRPGVSGGAVLALNTRLASPPEGYSASFRPSIRVDGPHEIWLAGTFPAAALAGLTVRIGDQTLRASGPPVSLYGEDLGWLRFGEASFVRGPVEVEVRFDGADGAEAALDAVVLTPRPFRPDGLRRPPL
jgi:hypothetical protein